MTIRTATLEAPRQSAMKAQHDGRSSVEWAAPFGMDEKGLYREAARGEGKIIRVAQPFRVLALIRTVDADGWGKRIAWKNPDGQEVEHVVFDGDLLDQIGACRTLVDKGLRIYEPASLARALQTVECKARERLLQQLGWNGQAYALGERVFGAVGEEQLRFVGPTQARKVHGSLDGWRGSIGGAAVGNSRLVAAVSLAFVPPLLRPLKMDGLGLHLVGSSSIGKTTALRASASVWGLPIGTWRATANGLEGAGAMSNDALLPLDELSEIDPKDAGATAYMLANGSGKARAKRDGSARKRLEYRLAYISTGEVGLSTKLQEDGRQRVHMAGQAIRLLEVPADSGTGHGLFETLHGHSSAGALATHLAKLCEVYQGTAIEAFLSQLVDTIEERIPELCEYVERLQSTWSQADDDGQVGRAASKFALIAVAGELATTFGITGWPSGEAERAAATMFSAWCEARGGRGAAEQREVLRKLRLFLQLHGVDRFRDEAPRRAGFTQKVRGRECFCFFSEVWTQEVFRGMDQRVVRRVLQGDGLLVHDAGRSTVKVRHKRVGMDVFAVPDLILDESPGEDADGDDRGF